MKNKFKEYNGFNLSDVNKEVLENGTQNRFLRKV